jgi:DNA repair exonuclease SbcCD nuclease subunit
MAFRFIHAADIHLDSQLRGLDRYEGAPVDEIRSAARRALGALVDMALHKAVAFVIIAGDVYDGDWQDFNTGLYFVNQMSRLRAAGIAVVMISGNHDAANRMTKSLELPDNVCSLPTEKPCTVEGREIGFGLESLDVAFHGQGFHTAAIDENVVLQYPPAKPGGFNIGLLHTSLDMEAGGEHARYAPCTVNDLLARQYDYWALGHVHRRRIVHENPPIIYPGNIQGRHIRETGAKGCMVVTVDDHGKPTWDFEPLDVFRWYELPVQVDGAADGDQVLQLVSAAIRDLLAEHGDLPAAVRVTLTGSCPAHDQLAASPVQWTNQVRAVSLSAGSGAVWIEKVKLRTSPSNPRDTTEMDEGPLREVAEYLQQLRERDELLVPLAGQLSDLARKLPDDLSTTDIDEPIRLADPDYLRRMLDEIEPLLLTRLGRPEGGA